VTLSATERLEQAGALVERRTRRRAVAHRYQPDAHDPGKPVWRMRVRALMIPPRIADF
jgi:hypothetical protein